MSLEIGGEYMYSRLQMAAEGSLVDGDDVPFAGDELVKGLVAGNLQPANLPWRLQAPNKNAAQSTLNGITGRSLSLYTSG